MEFNKITKNIIMQNNIINNTANINTTVANTNTLKTYKNTNRENSIELLRIIFTFTVIMFHLIINKHRREDFGSLFNSIFNTQAPNYFFSLGYLAVECFFVIGGFFLYKSVLNYKQSNSYFIKNLYIRLAPPLIIVFLLNYALGTTNIKYIFNILALNAGLSLPTDVTGWGDWYVGVYFYVSILYFAILHYNPKKNLIFILVITYIALCILFANNNLATLVGMKFNGFYFKTIGTNVVRGLACVGIGILFGALCFYVNFKTNKILTYFYTALEVILLLLIITTVTYRLNINYTTLLLALGLFLVISVKRLGYLAVWLNKISVISFASKYCYSVFISHILFIRSYNQFKWFNAISPNMQTLAVVLSAIILGVLIYHLVEIKLVKWFKNQSLASAK